MRNVWNVPGTSELTTTVRSRVVDCRKWYRSAPCFTSRGSGSNDSAGFRNSSTLRIVPGKGRDASRSMSVGDVSFGSYRSRRMTRTVSLENPNTPLPMKNIESVCAGGGTQNELRA